MGTDFGNRYLNSLFVLGTYRQEPDLPTTDPPLIANQQKSFKNKSGLEVTQTCGDAGSPHLLQYRQDATRRPVVSL